MRYLLTWIAALILLSSTPAFPHGGGGHSSVSHSNPHKAEGVSRDKSGHIARSSTAKPRPVSLTTTPVLECLHGESTFYGQHKGECQDNYGNKYHLVFRP